MKYETRIKRVHELHGTCFQYNVKNSESTILLYLFVLKTLYTLVGSCVGQIILRISSDIFISNLGLRSERLF
jgi:hypothetical protein